MLHFATMRKTERYLFRTMTSTAGVPASGPKDLGVRVDVDITPDRNRVVHPQSGGMSVAPDDPMGLPRFHRPKSLSGTGHRPVWKIRTDSVVGDLSTRNDPQKPTKHALIEPSMAMQLDKFESAICKTGPDWTKAHD